MSLRYISAVSLMLANCLLAAPSENVLSKQAANTPGRALLQLPDTSLHACARADTTQVLPVTCTTTATSTQTFTTSSTQTTATISSTSSTTGSATSTATTTISTTTATGTSTTSTSATSTTSSTNTLTSTSTSTRTTTATTTRTTTAHTTLSTSTWTSTRTRTTTRTSTSTRTTSSSFTSTSSGTDTSSSTTATTSSITASTTSTSGTRTGTTTTATSTFTSTTSLTRTTDTTTTTSATTSHRWLRPWWSSGITGTRHCAPICQLEHLAGCSSALAPGSTCVPQVMSNPCMASGEQQLVFGCPWNNDQEGRPVQWSGSLPRQLCHICGSLAETQLLDEDPRPSFFAGVISFGPAAFGGAVNERLLHGYRVYVVAANGTKLGAPVATIPKRWSAPPDECCSGDVYSVRVELELVGERASFARFGIFIMVGGIDLPIAAPTAAIVDVAPASCNTSVCPLGYEALQNVSSCASQTCRREECCQALGTCSELTCDDSDPPLHIPKMAVPSFCANATCTLVECCEIAAWARQDSTQEAASTAIVGVIVVGLMVFFSVIFCAVAKRRGHRRTKSGNKVYPVADFDGVACFDEPTSEDPEASKSARFASLVVSLDQEDQQASEMEGHRKVLESRGMVDRCMAHLRCVSHQEEEDCCRLLLGIIQSVQRFPHEQRYRQVDCRNEVLARHFFTVPGAEGLLEAAGFRQDPFGHCFKLGLDAPQSMSQLVADTIETRLRELREESWDKQAPIIFAPDIQCENSTKAVEEIPWEQKKRRPISAKELKHKRERDDGTDSGEEPEEAPARAVSWDSTFVKNEQSAQPDLKRIRRAMGLDEAEVAQSVAEPKKSRPVSAKASKHKRESNDGHGSSIYEELDDAPAHEEESSDEEVPSRELQQEAHFERLGDLPKLPQEVPSRVLQQEAHFERLGDLPKLPQEVPSRGLQQEARLGGLPKLQQEAHFLKEPQAALPKVHIVPPEKVVDLTDDAGPSASEQKKSRPVSAKASKHKRESNDGPGIYEELDDAPACEESWDEEASLEEIDEESLKQPQAAHPELEHPPENLEEIDSGPSLPEQKKLRPISAKASKHKRESVDGPCIYEELDDTAALATGWDAACLPKIRVEQQDSEHTFEQVDGLEEAEAGQESFREAQWLS